jgi:hypothetical protein
VAALEASRAHIELFRACMEDRGLAASTIDWRVESSVDFRGLRESLVGLVKATGRREGETEGTGDATAAAK